LTPLIPTSVSTGQKFTNFLNLLIFQAPIHIKNSFDELLVPFRAVCTDIKSGKEIVLADGDISEAMRASSSVSFLLSPVERETMLLADGGLVANIPTVAAKNLGADIIIAVNTTSPLRKFEELDVPWYMADQVVSIPLKLIESEALKIADVVIEPQIEHLSTDFKGLDSLIQIGYQTTLNQIEKIKSLIYNRYNQNLQAKSFQINDLIYVHHSEKTIDSLSLSYSRRKSLSSAEILDDLYKISNGKISSIRLTVKQKEDFTIPEFAIITQPSIKEILINGIKYSQFQNESKYFDDLIDKPFDSKALSDRLIQLLRYYRNSGYALIDINRVEFDSAVGTLRIETTPGLIDSIIIQGNNKTNNSIIQREILIDAGEMFDISKVSNRLTNLNATNLFEQTFAFLDNNGLRKNLIFKVKEKNSGLIRFGVRGDNERNLQIAADLRDENFFGTATELGFLFNGGLKNRYFGLEYRSNRVLKTFFTYKIKSYYDLIDRFTYADEPTTDVQEWSRVQVGEYREIKYGLSLAVGTQIEKLGNIYIEARREKHQIKSIYGAGYEPAYYDFFGIKLGSIFDSQNKYPFPTDGVLISVHYETSQKILGGDISYSKIHFSYEAYHTYFYRHTIIPKFVFGFADITLPLAEQFHLGGQNSFFGLRENDFIGRQLFLASLEYRFLFPFKVFFDTYFKIRYDLGSAWLTPTSIRYKDFRHGIGVSLSFD
ncbi:MAG: BamA/TamA family outer membrane protein, partial [Ignavibacteria bacterium]|nr:BamA/TamA family outer membrane protein [Ignavibacteria bacterium]